MPCSLFIHVPKRNENRPQGTLSNTALGAPRTEGHEKTHVPTTRFDRGCPGRPLFQHQVPLPLCWVDTRPVKPRSLDRCFWCLAEVLIVPRTILKDEPLQSGCTRRVCVKTSRCLRLNTGKVGKNPTGRSRDTSGTRVIECPSSVYVQPHSPRTTRGPSTRTPRVTNPSSPTWNTTGHRGQR